MTLGSITNNTQKSSCYGANPPSKQAANIPMQQSFTSNPTLERAPDSDSASFSTNNDNFVRTTQPQYRHQNTKTFLKNNWGALLLGVSTLVVGGILTKGKLWGKTKAFDNKASKIYDDAMINNLKNVYEELFSNQAKIAKEKFGIDMAKPKFSVSSDIKHTAGGHFDTETGEIAMSSELLKKDSHIMFNGKIRQTGESGMQSVLEKLNDKEITKAGEFELRKITQEEHQEYITGMISHELEHSMQLDLIRRMPDFEAKYLNGMKKIRSKDFEGLSDTKILEKLKQEDAFMFEEGVAKINSSKMIVTDEKITLNGKIHHVKYTVEDLFNALVNYSNDTTTALGKNVYFSSALEIGANLRGYRVMQKKLAQSNIQKDANEGILKMYTDYLSDGLNGPRK